MHVKIEASFSIIGALCVNGAVRLIGGLVSTEGTVQMCVSGKWRELCYSGWGYQEAFVVCRQMGLPATCEYVDCNIMIITINLSCINLVSLNPTAAIGEMMQQI